MDIHKMCFYFKHLLDRNLVSQIEISQRVNIIELVMLPTLHTEQKMFFSVCVYGGGSRKGQIQVVQKGVEIVIGKYIQCTI